MEVFECRRCGMALTAPVSRVPFPLYAGLAYGNGHPMPVLMESGTYALNAEPPGLSAESERGELPGSVLMAPGDVHGTVLIPERSEGDCCGLSGHGGPNLACLGCGRPVATRVDDCSLWQATWLEAAAVRPVPAGPPRPIADWRTLTDERCATAPLDADGRWEPRWEAEVSVTMAHLVHAAAGSPVTVSDGPLADAFRGLLGELLPSAGPARRAVLAGPGRPLPDPLPDVAVVPRHPQTGESWPTPPGVAAAPLAAGFWAYLAHHQERLRRPATGGLPPGVERDDPLPPHPWRRLMLVWGAYSYALERLKAVPVKEVDVQ